MFKIAYFEHPSEGKKAAGLSEDTRESSYATYILYVKPKCVGRFVLFHHQIYFLNLYSKLMSSFKKIYLKVLIIIGQIVIFKV